jgi:hypothetical protein
VGPVKPARTWTGFCVLVTLIFIARSLFVLSILPPFEAWDEYQHIAYVAFVAERDRPPKPGEFVPKSLYPAFARYPQPTLALRGHLDRMGALGYAEYWKAPEPPRVVGPSPPIELYEAQHPSLYYRLMAPIMERWSGPDGILTAITLMRLFGVLCGAATVLLIGLSLPALVERPGLAHLALLVIGVYPLLLSDCARVANDPLAVLLGTVAVVALLRLPGRRPRATAALAALAGVAIGFGSLTKVFDFMLLPFAGVVLLGHAWRGRMGWGQAVRAGLLVFGLAGLITAHYVLRNLRDFGAITPMQELVTNASADLTLLDYLAAATERTWLASLYRHYVTHSLGLSGWTFVKTPYVLRTLYAAGLLAGALGGAVALVRRLRRGPASRQLAGPAPAQLPGPAPAQLAGPASGPRPARQPVFRSASTGVHLAVLGLCFAAGVAFHAVSAQLAIGGIFSNINYAMISLPWLYLLWLAGVAALPGRHTLLLLGLAMASLMLLTEVRGMLVTMVRAFTGQGWGPVARDRLASMHTAWLGPELTLPLLGVVLVLLGVAVLATHAALRESAAA